MTEATATISRAGTIAIRGPVCLPQVEPLAAQFEQLLRQTGPAALTVDLSQISALDTAGAVFVEAPPMEASTFF